MAVSQQIRGEYLIQNRSFMAVADFYAFDTATIIYEVIRIINGVPLFLEDHLTRLQNSCAEMQVEVDWNRFDFQKEIQKLAHKNAIANGNVMLRLIHEDNKIVERLYFIPHTYPTAEMYEQGVEVGLLSAERIHPNAKVVQSDLRSLTNEYLAAHNKFEVLLVDRSGKITEGSRSNFFFIHGNKLITAPLHTVLKGITLLKVLQIAAQLNIEVVYRQVAIDALGEYQAAFVTGTSPKILPVSKVGDQAFDVKNALLHQLIKAYDETIDNYVHLHKL